MFPLFQELPDNSSYPIGKKQSTGFAGKQTGLVWRNMAPFQKKRGTILDVGVGLRGNHFLGVCLQTTVLKAFFRGISERSTV